MLYCGIKCKSILGCKAPMRNMNGWLCIACHTKLIHKLYFWSLYICHIQLNKKFCLRGRTKFGIVLWPLCFSMLRNLTIFNSSWLGVMGFFVKVLFVVPWNCLNSFVFSSITWKFRLLSSWLKYLVHGSKV